MMKINKRTTINILLLSMAGILLFLSGPMVLAADPSLQGVQGWFTDEVQIAIGLIALGLCIYLGYKQQIGAIIGVVLFASFIFFMANDPTTIFEGIGGLFEKVFGG